MSQETNEIQRKLINGRPLMWTVHTENELYLYHNGELVYKRWYKKGSTEKRQPSLLWNRLCKWMNEWIQ